MKVLVFDIWGKYAHFKKIYATTSALSYAIPTKTAIYGYIGAILGLEKNENRYLQYFENKSCLIGIAVRKPLVMKRLGINLKAELGRKKENAPPKPTMMEFVQNPHYRIYFAHSDDTFFNKLENALRQHHCVYTPTLGLANLLSSFELIESTTTEGVQNSDAAWIHAVIPRQSFLGFGKEMFDNQTPDTHFSIVEQSMYALEMDLERNVTQRDDILLERTGKPILAKVNTYYPINGENVCFF